MKKIAVVPTLLTLGNGICGFVAITFASKIGLFGRGTAEATLSDEFHFVWAGWFILFAMLFDMLDGYVARMSRTASAFGALLPGRLSRNGLALGVSKNMPNPPRRTVPCQTRGE